MSPLYEHICPKCGKLDEYYRTMADASKDEYCRECGGLTERKFTFHREKEYFAYYDDQYNVEITSKRQEKELMKKNGHVYVKDTPLDSKFKDVKKAKRKNRLYI